MFSEGVYIPAVDTILFRRPSESHLVFLLLCAFVRRHGLRLLEKELKAHCASGRKLRVITTVFTGSTERKAIDWLVQIGAEVKVSYDTRSTRLHAKAWMFRRDTGYSTA